jgi:DNA-binding GntR family transcriptional regulator
VEPTVDHLFGAQPRYAQLAGLLRGQITEGHIPPGGRLPSLRELCEQHQVSRVTAERAIDVLRHEGLVSGVPGVGTFAAEPARKRARARTPRPRTS